jgi:hypothetical protein
MTQIIKIPVNGRPEERLVVNKVIYISRYPRTRKQINDVLQLEIDYVLSKKENQDWEFEKCEEAIDNPDRSKMYQLRFKKKSVLPSNLVL